MSRRKNAPTTARESQDRTGTPRYAENTPENAGIFPGEGDQATPEPSEPLPPEKPPVLGLRVEDGEYVGELPANLSRDEFLALGHRPISPQKAIRLRCLDCRAGYRSEVRKCNIFDCPNFPMRMGKNRWRQKTDPARDAKKSMTLVGMDPSELSIVELKTLGHTPKSPLKTIRSHCLDCCLNQPGEVRKCVALKCPHWPFRMGTNPWRRQSSQCPGR